MAMAVLHMPVFVCLVMASNKLCCGIILSILVGCCWTVMIHSIKRVILTTRLFSVDRVMAPSSVEDSSPSTLEAYSHNDHGNVDYHDYGRKPPIHYPSSFVNSHFNASQGLDPVFPHTTPATAIQTAIEMQRVYDAPFFTAWILTFCTVLFYPFHQMTVRFCSCMGRKGPKSMSRAISDAIQGFRERGMTLFQFMGRCTALCCLWLFTNYLIVASLRILRATEVLALFATTTSFVYLLSWVVLHQQFVGLRILAVILSNMGIALFAYMDGQTHKSKTVGGVLLSALAAGFSAVFKVSLKKMFGVGATISQQVALIFSVMGLISMLILWPIFLTLYFTGVETIMWQFVPWEFIIYAVLAFLLVSMLDNFGVTCTFEFFITIGLLMAIPFTAAVDTRVYSQIFDGMCLAGIITISIGFVVVLLPENWPDYITRLIRRFRGDVPPPEEEKQHPNSAHAHPRLSRSGLDNLLVNPPHNYHSTSQHSPRLNHHHHNSHHQSNPAHSSTSMFHHVHPVHTNNVTNHTPSAGSTAQANVNSIHNALPGVGHVNSYNNANHSNHNHNYTIQSQANFTLQNNNNNNLLNSANANSYTAAAHNSNAAATHALTNSSGSHQSHNNHPLIQPLHHNQQYF